MQASYNTTEKTIQSLLDKVDDLENQTRQNILCVIGLPETYKPDKLHHQALW